MIVQLLMSVVAAQDCFQLEHSTACPDLQSASIRPFGQVTDVVSFDKFIMESVVDSSPVAISTFKQTYACPAYAGKTVRYRQSTICSFLLSVSGTCNTDNAVQPLCKGICDAHVLSVSQTFNSTSCDNPVSGLGKTNRDSFFAQNDSSPSISDFCSRLPSSGSCLTGQKPDFQMCGFAFQESASAYCKAFSKDPCCSAQSAGSSNSGPNVVMIIGAILGVIALLACLLYVRHRTISSNSGDVRAEAGQFRKNERPSLEPLKTTGTGAHIRDSAFLEDNSATASAYSRHSNPFHQQSGNSDVSGDQEKILANYTATRPDEMDVHIGDVILVTERFDDGNNNLI